jgi:signal transduction histidine kinase
LDLEMAGRSWSLEIVSTPAFERTSSTRLLPYVIALALLINLAFFLATRAQVRARNEERTARQRLTTLAETSKVFSAAQLELRVVLETVCREVTHRLKESCTINLLDATGTLELAATGHLNPEAEVSIRGILAETPVRLGESSLGTVAATGKPLLLSDLPLHAQLASAKAEYREHFERFPIASLLVVPLRIGERIIGTMTSARSPGLPSFTLQDRDLLQDIADRAAFAIENARLAERLRSSMHEAQDAVRLRDEFLSIAGHELKTPLAALQLQIEGLHRQAERGAFGPAPRRLLERLGKAQTQVQRLEVLVTGLLDVSRIAAGRLTLQLEEVDLASILHDVIDRFDEQLSRSKCAVSMEMSEHIVGCWDRIRLDQVFTNLMSNAVKYGAGKPIDIRVARENGCARVLVRDRGIGISEFDRPRIFGRFERAVSERNYGGLGLGLWISKQIVESLGGTIDLESRIGAGSTFIVELPLEMEEA